ncbi:transposase [Salipiger sp. IMCC34102]|nr:transposase [Salipiger sp. IMCC34102]
MKRRKFSRGFKIEAVKLVSERGVSVSQADCPHRVEVDPKNWTLT